MTDDFKPDDRYLPPKLKAIIANIPPAKDLSAAFHHAVCWLHELKWSATKIDATSTASRLFRNATGRLQQEDLPLPVQRGDRTRRARRGE